MEQLPSQSPIVPAGARADQLLAPGSDNREMLAQVAAPERASAVAATPQSAVSLAGWCAVPLVGMALWAAIFYMAGVI